MKLAHQEGVQDLTLTLQKQKQPEQSHTVSTPSRGTVIVRM